MRSNRYKTLISGIVRSLAEIHISKIQNRHDGSVDVKSLLWVRQANVSQSRIQPTKVRHVIDNRIGQGTVLLLLKE